MGWHRETRQDHGKIMESPEHAQGGIFAVVVVNCTLGAS